MSEKIKNSLGIAIIIAVLAVGFSSLSFAGAYKSSIQPSSYRAFSVSGEGKVTTVPDIARVSVGIVVEGSKDLALIQKQATERGNKVTAFVKKQGVDAKDIKTEQYSVEPRYQYFNCSTPIYSSSQTVAKPCPPPEIVGYTIRQSISLKMRDFDKIGGIMSGVVENGANTVSSLSFTVDDPTKIESEARSKAIEQAKEKAAQVAKAGGFSIGRLLSIEEGGVNNYDRYAYKSSEVMMSSAGAGAAPAPTIEAGSQDVTANVTLRYEIK